MFFANADRARSLKLDLDVSFTTSIYTRRTLWHRFYLRIAIYRNGSSYDYSRSINLIFKDNNIGTYNNKKLSVTRQLDLDLKEGESASLQFTRL